MRNYLLTIVALLAAVTPAAEAKVVKYLYRSWNNDTKELVTETREVEATSLHDVAKDGEWMGLGDGWYYMEGERINIKTLNIVGKDVHLILGDGTIFECYGGIKLEEGHKLSIYGQSDGSGAGLLWAHQGTSSSAKGYDEMAGIGAGKNAKVGNLDIHGGRIKAEGSQYGAGIGGGCHNDFKNLTTDVEQKGTINIYGGTVEGYGGEGGAGIGGGSQGRLDAVNIYGGDIWATGGKLAAGVGTGGSYSEMLRNKDGVGLRGSVVKIYGGNLTAQGGFRGAGIGNGNAGWGSGKKRNLHGGWTYIYGGVVKATGGQYAAGIGGGCNCDGGYLTIVGGDITATAGEDAAGIGGGEDGSGSIVEITGGVVRAYGKGYGAGIGGGMRTTHSRYDDGGAQGSDGSDGNTVTISGGTVTAVAGEKCHGTWSSDGSAIGPGYGRDKNKGNHLGTLTINTPMKVTAPESDSDNERLYTAPERVSACQWRNSCRVEVCNHSDADAISYSQESEEKHRKYCKYCGETTYELHEYIEGKCVCGKEYNKETDTWTVTVYKANASGTAYDEGTTYSVIKGHKLAIPGPDAIEGLKFMQWKQNPASAPESIEMKDADFDVNAPVALEITPTSNVTIYAQYRYVYDEKWTWAEDLSSATLTLMQGDQVVKSDIAATVTIDEAEPTESADGYKKHTASAKWEKAAGITYQFADVHSVPYISQLTLQDNADNQELIERKHGVKVNMVTLSERTLYKDGSWNTLCLPFDVTISGSQLDGDNVEAKVLDAANCTLNAGTLTLKFVDAPATIPAGTPFVIKWDKGGNDIENPVFQGVAIDANMNDVTVENVLAFIGTYDPVSFTSNGDNTKLYLGSDNKLYYPKTEMTIRCQRAFFQLAEGLTVGDPSSSQQTALDFVLDFGDEEATGIKEIKAEDEYSFKEGWYTIGGSLLGGQPAAKGVFIQNGRKVLVK